MDGVGGGRRWATTVKGAPPLAGLDEELGGGDGDFDFSLGVAEGEVTAEEFGGAGGAFFGGEGEGPGEEVVFELDGVADEGGGEGARCGGVGGLEKNEIKRDGSELAGVVGGFGGEGEGEKLAGGGGGIEGEGADRLGGGGGLEVLPEMELGEGGELVEKGGKAEEDALAEVLVEGSGVFGEGFAEFFFGGIGEVLNREVAGEKEVDGGAFFGKGELGGEETLGKEINKGGLFGRGGGLQVVDDEIAGGGDEASDLACENGDDIVIDLLKVGEDAEAVACDIEFTELFGGELLRDALLDGVDDFFGGDGGEDGGFLEGEAEVVFDKGDELGIGNEVFFEEGGLRKGELLRLVFDGKGRVGNVGELGGLRGNVAGGLELGEEEGAEEGDSEEGEEKGKRFHAGKKTQTFSCDTLRACSLSLKGLDTIGRIFGRGS